MKVWPVCIGHWVMYAGPSDHPVRSCLTPCLKRIKAQYSTMLRTKIAEIKVALRQVYLYQWIETFSWTWLTTLTMTVSSSLAYKLGPGNFPFTTTMGLLEHILVVFLLTTCIHRVPYCSEEFRKQTNLSLFSHFSTQMLGRGLKGPVQHPAWLYKEIKLLVNARS